jgi:hypothetical protein
MPVPKNSGGNFFLAVPAIGIQNTEKKLLEFGVLE